MIRIICTVMHSDKWLCIIFYKRRQISKKKRNLPIHFQSHLSIPSCTCAWRSYQTLISSLITFWVCASCGYQRCHPSLGLEVTFTLIPMLKMNEPPILVYDAINLPLVVLYCFLISMLYNKLYKQILRSLWHVCCVLF